MCGPTACALQKDLMQIRELAGSLLSRDAYDRWSHGPPEEKEENLAAMAREDREIRALREQLSLRVQQNVFYVHYNEKLYRSYFG